MRDKCLCQDIGDRVPGTKFDQLHAAREKIDDDWTFLGAQVNRRHRQSSVVDSLMYRQIVRLSRIRPRSRFYSVSQKIPPEVN